MEGKYGPGQPADTPADAARRLNAYERTVRAANTSRAGPRAAPAARLEDTQLSALFSPRALGLLVKKPLHVDSPCGQPADGEKRAD